MLQADENPDGARGDVVGYLRSQLIGPVGGRGEIISDPPHRRYLAGILFPGEADVDGGLDGDILDESQGETGDEGTGDPIALTTQQLPSSVGLSFVLPEWAPFLVEVSAGRYARSDGGWQRTQLERSEDRSLRIDPPPSPGWGPEVEVPGWNACVKVLWREVGTGGAALVTVALVNANRLPDGGRVDAGDALFQVQMRCLSSGGFQPYPVPMRMQTGDEEEELALLYRDVPTYAVGHGAAALWEQDNGGHPGWVSTSYMPDHVVPGVAFSLPQAATTQENPAAVLSLATLSGINGDSADVIQLLDRFVDGYDGWARDLEPVASVLGTRHTAAGRRVLQRIEGTRIRMRRGVRQLESDPDIRRAFTLANEAMLMQMVRSGPDYAGRRRTVTDPSVKEPDYKTSTASWRPFQLAFLLLTMESVADDSSPDRDLIDLIWFPTGGGKTEAYLALLAFTVFHRRILAGDDGAGTTVITRYTLRLLTSQQFQRAATLVCACERLRAEDPARLGTRAISIGVWLGGNNSPNTYADAVELLGKMQNNEWTEKSFQVDSCPWCGTELVPGPGATGAGGAWGISASNDSFRMNCPSPACDFHDALPVSSVDQDLYDRPPTVLIGTVDKFARMAWDDSAGVFLGAGGDPGPSLIIQDEFHLISGPLGTVVGLYEAAFDVVMQRHHARPKVVASTATIRRAEEQGRGVFGRSTALFPPPGLSADDSYFVRYDTTQPGRRYVGIMPQGHTPLTAMVHLSAALLQSSEEIHHVAPEDDAYWTVVAYHNSLRELGKTVTLAHDDIPARIGVIAETEDSLRRLGDDQIVELTSNVPPSEIPGKIEILKRPRTERGSVSFVASTNMLSVGVDVSRLGLMLIVGQPKTTAEYIQASSRVGRSSPGLVCTLYSPSKPRDRSHYESFVPFHSALYRNVEPTSVTPFSVPARQRALHAALVVIARHAVGLASNDSADAFDTDDPVLQELVDEFMRRVDTADAEELAAVGQHLDDLRAHWMGLIDEARPSGGLRYKGGGKQSVALLRRFNQPGPGWPTLDSMRSVDTEVRMRVRGEDA